MLYFLVRTNWYDRALLPFKPNIELFGSSTLCQLRLQLGVAVCGST